MNQHEQETGAQWSPRLPRNAPSTPPHQPMVGTQPAGPWGHPPPKKRRRVFMWIFLAIQVLFLVWVITGASAASGSPGDCGSLDAETCNDASDAGTAIGVGLVILLWAVVDIILGITYAVVRIARR
ncbi:hypothetical protein [Streptomyces sp. NPDC052225]|uniref:hypothetical protein n=1 Tax=Streptomyces sp. NPDC052225 TaxID=3154949 RepID=UPI0034448C43